MKLHEAKIYTELTPRELAIALACVGQTDFKTLNRFLAGVKGCYCSKKHVDSLFETSSSSGESTDQFKLFKKLQKLMDDVVEKTEPKIQTVYYYICVSIGDNVPYVSGAYNTYKDAVDNFNSYMKSSFKLVEIASRQVDTNI